MIRRLCIVAVFGLSAFAVCAGPLQEASVTASARWVMHADMDALRQSEIGRFIMGRLNEGPAANKMAAFTALFGFDPLKDVAEITVYGTSQHPESAVMLVRGRLNENHLAALIKANDTYQAETYGQRTIHSWVDAHRAEEGRKYGCFHSPERLVIGRDLSLLKAALDVLDGKGASLNATSAFGGPVPADALLFIGATDLASLTPARPEAAAMAQAQDMVMSLTEQGGLFSASVGMRMQTAEAASNVQAVAQGMVSFAKLNQQANPLGAKLVDSFRSVVNGTSVRMDVAMPTADMLPMLAAKMDAHAAMCDLLP